MPPAPDLPLGTVPSSQADRTCDAVGGNLMRYRNVLLPVLACATLSLGCGSDEEPDVQTAPRDETTTSRPVDDPAQTQRFCDAVEEWATQERDGNDDTLPSTQKIDALRAYAEGFKTVPETAPRSLKDEMRVLTGIDPMTVVASEKEMVDTAYEKVDAYVEEHCDVIFSFSNKNLFDV